MQLIFIYHGLFITDCFSILQLVVQLFFGNLKTVVLAQEANKVLEYIKSLLTGEAFSTHLKSNDVVNLVRETGAL